YYAVIFANNLADNDGYEQTAQRMSALAEGQPGYLGHESTRGTDGFGITVSYWKSEEDIARWKSHAEHFAAQEEGIHRFYEHYELRVARVERAYSGPEGRGMNTDEEEKS
ncbi:MAG: antibiotic biosynthesis monooxygenase, partial [Pseudomonadota bacterium]